MLNVFSFVPAASVLCYYRHFLDAGVTGGQIVEGPETVVACLCSWYKTKDADGKIMNGHNTAPSYHAQRLFLATGRERNTRLFGMGKSYGGSNAILANKRADGGNPAGALA
jgi:hypothetical protein